MGITFIEDDELLRFVEREMDGVYLSDERPPEPTRFDTSLNEFNISYSASIRSENLEDIEERYERQSRVSDHIEAQFLIGFSDDSENLAHSNAMSFANDNSVNFYRYYRSFLERDENAWIDAELFEKALAGWTSSDNLQVEALERLQTAYTNFKAETDHLSHEYNQRVYDINNRFEDQFEQLKQLIENPSSVYDEKSSAKLEEAINSMNKNMPMLFDEQRTALANVIGRNEKAKEKLQSYFQNITKTILQEALQKGVDNHLEKNLFAIRRIKEHAESISLAKQAVKKAFD